MGWEKEERNRNRREGRKGCCCMPSLTVIRMPLHENVLINILFRIL